MGKSSINASAVAGPAAPRRGSDRAEFSRTVRLAELESGPLAREIEADPAERAALAERFGLLSLDRLIAALEMHAGEEAGLFRVAGRLTADLAQVCVVTLDPAPAHVEADFDIAFTTDPERSLAWDRDADIAAEADDPPEPVVGGAIDIGEAVAQQLALALDPYPRRSDASIEALEAEDALRQPPVPGPFAALARLKSG